MATASRKSHSQSDSKSHQKSRQSGGSEHGSHTTTDRDEIIAWAEARGAKPSCVKGTGGKNDIGILRLDFPGYSGEGKLHEISWDDWFDKFEEQGLALVYQENTADGEKSNFNKLISREHAKKS